MPWEYRPNEFDAIDNHVFEWVNQHKFHVHFATGETDKGRFYFLMFYEPKYEMHFRLAWTFNIELDD